MAYFPFFQAVLKEMPSNQAENMSAQETDDGVVNLSSEYYPILSLRSLLY